MWDMTGNETFVCSLAAGCGQLEILKWARENGCPEYPEDDEDHGF